MQVAGVADESSLVADAELAKEMAPLVGMGEAGGTGHERMRQVILLSTTFVISFFFFLGLNDHERRLRVIRISLFASFSFFVFLSDEALVGQRRKQGVSFKADLVL